MTQFTKHTFSELNNTLAFEIGQVTAEAAIAAARLRGHGNEKQADQVAVDAMRSALNRLNIDGTIVIGEGERDEAPMLFIGEEVGTKKGPAVDIALDPLEGTTLCAKNMSNSLSVIAVSKKGSLLYAPDVYMKKLAIGPGYPKGVVDLQNSVSENIFAVAKEKNVTSDQIVVCVMDRPRHATLISEIRSTGAAVKLIGDGDIAGVLHTTHFKETGIDLYMGIGGAPEGVLAAAALRCVGGYMQGRLILDTDEKKARAHKMGIKDYTKIYTGEEMAGEDVIFAATGVTDGDLLSGVNFCKDQTETETLIMRSGTKTLQWIKSVIKNNQN